MVLIVEDNASIRESLEVLVELEGFHAVSAGNGKIALDILHSGLKPGLILLDLCMPVMDGFAFRREQLNDSKLSDIPVVVLSAAYDPRVDEEHLRADAYLGKPANPRKLLDTIKHYCQVRQQA